MPSARPLSDASRAHRPGDVGPAPTSGMSFRFARVLGLPAANSPMTRSGAVTEDVGRQSKKLVCLRRSRSGTGMVSQREVPTRYLRERQDSMRLGLEVSTGNNSS